MLCQLFASCRVNCIGVQCKKYCLSEASYQLRHVRCAFRSFTWSTNLRSAYPLDMFDRVIGGIIGRLVHSTVLSSRSGVKQWCDASCRGAYRAWCRARRPENWGQFVLARAEAQGVYGAARESQNERTRKTLKHSTSYISVGDT